MDAIAADAQRNIAMPTTAMMIDALLEMRKDPEGVSAELFWQLVERFRADLVNQAFAILGQQEDAEDIAQDSLCQAFQDLAKLENPLRLGNWLRTINRCKCVDLLRKHKRDWAKVTADENATAVASAPETTPTGSNLEQKRRKTNVEMVARAVDALPTPYREVVILRYWEKLTYEQTADCLGIPVGTVKSRLARADHMLIRQLRRLWAEYPGDPS